MIRNGRKAINSTAPKSVRTLFKVRLNKDGGFEFELYSPSKLMILAIAALLIAGKICFIVADRIDWNMLILHLF